MVHFKVNLIQKTWPWLIINLLFMVACTNGSQIQNEGSLAGSSWILVDLTQSDAPTALVPGSVITAVFTPTHISGTSGCNDYGGPYTLNGNTIQITEPASTAMDCPSLLLEQESQFLAALHQATSFSVGEDELVLETAVSTLIFHKLQPLPLEGTNWQLTGIAQDGVLIETWVDEGITAVFTNSQLTGSAGCNTYTGSYTQTDNILTITEIATPQMSCDTERDQREAQFLTALTAATSYITTQDSLTLLDTNNTPLLTFTQTNPPSPLSGVIWELVALETPDGPLPTQGTLITAQFIDETVAGTGGCNPYAANYFLAAEAYLLLLNNIGHGFESCANPIQQLENTFFGLLETSDSFTIGNNTLTIFSQRGTLTFATAQYSTYQPPFVTLPSGIRCSRTAPGDPMIINDKQRRYFCFQSGTQMHILTGEFQPEENGWLVEKAIIEGMEDNFLVKQTDTIRVTLP